MIFYTSILQNKKLRFGLTSTMATAIDHILFVFLVHIGLIPGLSNLLSQGSGIVVNFILQKEFIFKVKRKIWMAFMLSLGFSLLGLMLGSMIVHATTFIPVVSKVPYLGKIIGTGIIFFYNYFTKRFAFEKR